jgi:hypothetical protein
MEWYSVLIWIAVICLLFWLLHSYCSGQKEKGAVCKIDDAVGKLVDGAASVVDFLADHLTLTLFLVLLVAFGPMAKSFLQFCSERVQVSAKQVELSKDRSLEPLIDKETGAIVFGDKEGKPILDEDGDAIPVSKETAKRYEEQYRASGKHEIADRIANFQQSRQSDYFIKRPEDKQFEEIVIE